MTSQNARINMVKQQLRTGDVLDETILALYDEVPRHEFVPSGMQHFAYSDMQIPLSHDQRMMTPLEEGILLQALKIKKHETVLEIGTGTGFLTALLSKLAKKVISIDYYPDFTNYARRKLHEHHCNNVELITGDACRGWMDKAPYDVMVFTGSLEQITETHRLQLLPGGRLFSVVGREPAMQGQLHTLNYDGNWHARDLFETNLPPLINKMKPKEFVF
ncbi:protein-L-isoaspartate O-methyltransferase family protein [Legionella jordanis]|uniref:Protein-L-isoaspartate O-methyltransferase n=1 Tax=Legionella jordanis TaxID=456 RepID=A0A0W0V987_9GAMM|nr:protein-L-isoaspartate O-methyltransferase [Legionella jordanis]KTD16648.1 protein-L-isoaspartate-O-methyltransferase [Legionella jordanis]RMX03817.1 protein-L-isoaspartate O-methyltransferase [Legionella jordanis]RMX22121.1 protein-L-isoaspartate O-methyltransferase [Legionella jordanis]VEH11888.1 protein-L-isoaspartate-O-methyltransferase [Legionella jordanis]HAT8712807.1 methyltransferase domain-containing protein [Legionella jordanis]